MATKPCPQSGGHWLWFSRPWEGSWNPQAGETGVQTKGSLPWNHRLPRPHPGSCGKEVRAWEPISAFLGC